MKYIPDFLTGSMAFIFYMNLHLQDKFPGKHDRATVIKRIFNNPDWCVRDMPWS